MKNDETKAGATLLRLLLFGEADDWMFEPRFLICRKQEKSRARRGNKKNSIYFDSAISFALASRFI